MRHLLCRTCGLRASGSPAPADMTHVIPASEDGPAEFERFIWGAARHPKKSQRVIRVNGVPRDLPLDSFTCDGCGSPIFPGETACAHSAIDAGRRIAPWEDAYLNGIEVPR